MNDADDSAAAANVPPSKKSASPVSKDDAAPPAPPPQSEASSTPTETEAATTTTSTKKHQVTEVPKFRFVSIAKKSAGYSSAAAGRWVEGKSAQELAAKYQEPDSMAASTDPNVNKREEVVVGKLNIAERQAEMGLGVGHLERKELDDRVTQLEQQQEEEDEKEEEDVQPTPIIQNEKEEVKGSVEQSEEKDLEAAAPLETQNKLAETPMTLEQDKVVTQVENKQSSVDESMQGKLYCSDSGENIATALPVDKKDDKQSKEDVLSDDRRRKCSTKNRILSVVLIILLAVVAALAAVFATKQSKDDSSTGLRGENNNQSNEDDTSNTMATEETSEIPRWDAPTQSPMLPAATCIIESLAEEKCLEEPQIRQQLFVPRGGSSLVNINFGHSVVFINYNIIAAATDGSGSDAGVHIYFRDSLNLYSHHQSIYDGNEQNLFGYSLAATRKTNTLVVGAPAKARSEEEVKCVQEWCEICKWSTLDSTPCGERLDIIVQQSSNGDEETVKQQIMASGRCVAEVNCNEVVQQGKVFVYQPTEKSWNQVGTITSDDPSFGSVVAIEEDIIAIASPGEDNVKIYERNGQASAITAVGVVTEGLGIANRALIGWTLTDTITPPSRNSGVKFGSSLSLSEGILVIGAPLDSVGGVAYVYKRSGGSFIPLGRPLAPRDVIKGDNFGDQVSVSGCTVAVSSRNAETAFGTGSIKIFNYNPDLDLYSPDQIVEPMEEVAGVFPECLVMQDNNLLVGSSGAGSSSTGILTHFVRRSSGWTQQSVKPNPLQAGGFSAGFFGCGLSISDSTALVGAKGTEQGRPGSLSVFDLCPDDELI
mmetsp:Transcript_22623/g.36959  ORF Transcript_22623/g.36959 Transcript_22623/m.36959 type:complete len:822 (+) Transcript_22623:105-2570(+)